MKKICFVTYETRFSGRLDATAGLALLIASLGRHMPDIPLFVFHTKPCDHLKAFSEKFGPPCVFRQVDETSYYSWYGKPNAISEMRNSGFERVCWIDSDILLTQDSSSLLFPESPHVLVTAYEYDNQPSVPERHEFIFQCSPRKHLTKQINSCIISVSPKHDDIIDNFKWLVDKYALHESERIKSLFKGDQDFLELSIMHCNSLKTEINLLRNFKDIVHCRRSIGLRGVLKLFRNGGPPLLHAIDYKPWWPLDRPHWYAPRSLIDCYPYTVEARSYRSVLNELDYNMFRDWLVLSTLRSRFCHALPPWTRNSALLWFYLLHKVSPESIDPPEAELATALALLEQAEAVKPA